MRRPRLRLKNSALTDFYIHHSVDADCLLCIFGRNTGISGQRVPINYSADFFPNAYSGCYDNKKGTGVLGVRSAW